MWDIVLDSMATRRTNHESTLKGLKKHVRLSSTIHKLHMCLVLSKTAQNLKSICQFQVIASVDSIPGQDLKQFLEKCEEFWKRVFGKG